jgi:hypothetical protein
MNQVALMRDMRKATDRIISVRLPIRLRAGRHGVLVETESCLATGQRRLQAVVSWKALADAQKPLIKPLVDELIEFLERGGRPPSIFAKPAASRPLINRQHLH